jgi:hypothetical protein
MPEDSGLLQHKLVLSPCSGDINRENLINFSPPYNYSHLSNFLLLKYIVKCFDVFSETMQDF